MEFCPFTVWNEGQEAESRVDDIFLLRSALNLANVVQLMKYSVWLLLISLDQWSRVHPRWAPWGQIPMGAS